MYQKPKISYNTIKKNKTLSGFFTSKPEGKPLEEDEEVEA